MSKKTAPEEAQTHKDGPGDPIAPKKRATRPADPEVAAMAKLARIAEEINAIVASLNETTRPRVASWLQGRLTGAAAQMFGKTE